MRKFAIIALLALCMVLTACWGGEQSADTSGTEPTQTTSSTTQPTQTTAPKTGWQQVGNATYYYLEDGTAATGWQEIDEEVYYFAEDGVMQTGWISAEEGRYYLGHHGARVTGWQEVDGVRRYFRADGVLAAGWEDIDQSRYYFDQEGVACTGWLDVEDHRYYLGEEGVMVTGWLEQEGVRYYLKDNGAMARGCVEIDGVKNYFTHSGAYIIMVNPWNYVPEGYEVDLVAIDDEYDGAGNGQVDRSCYEDLIRMLADCEEQSGKAYVVSSYRTHEYQIKNHQRKVNYYLNLGYDEEEARRLASMVVAVPGTSEHELGLAVDIVDADYWYLDEHQATMPAQQWLMEHSWEYGFILRYPTGKTEVTGIIFEPWHYRYVGVEVSTRLHELGLTLEEYLQMLTEE